MGRSGHAGLLHDSEHCKPRCHRELGLSNYLLCHQWPGDGQRQHVNRQRDNLNSNRSRDSKVGSYTIGKFQLPPGNYRRKVIRRHKGPPNHYLS